jgi:hypothetical protein
MSSSTPQRKSALAVRSAAGAALATLLASAAHAGSFTELADAGQTLGTAQLTASTGALTDILGSLSSSTDADLFVIRITDPAAFSATTVNATGATLDTQLYLLTMAGAPVYLNDDAADGTSLLSTLPAGSSLGPTTPGLYILGMAMSGYDPVNINNQLLFANGLPTTMRGPATGLQPAALGGFFDSTFFCRQRRVRRAAHRCGCSRSRAPGQRALPGRRRLGRLPRRSALRPRLRRATRTHAQSRVLRRVRQSRHTALQCAAR